MRLRVVSTSKVKLLLAFLLLGLLAAGVGALLVGGGRLLFVTERGGTPAPIENPIVEMTAAQPGLASWDAPAPGSGRQLDPGTRDRITDAYLRAWRGIALGLESCSAEGLHTWLAPGPESQAAAMITDSAASGCRLRRADGGHRLRSTFVSADGGIVAFRDTGYWVVDRVVDPSGTVRWLERTADRQVVMRLDDGLWRVAAWREVASDPIAAAPALAVARPGFVAAVGGELHVDGVAWRPDGVNLYPAATPWRDFWRSYDPAIVDVDLARAAGLGFDAVRIFVPYGPGPDHPEEVALSGLDDFLARARAHDLRVIVTLFDLDVNYDPASWSGADRYLERVVGRFASDPAILAWDLKNEADLDDRQVGAGLVDAWLQHVLRGVRALDPHHLVTVGWSTPGMATRLADRLDLVTFHDYREVAALGTRLAAAGQDMAMAVPEGRPTLLTEYGASSWSSPLAPGGVGPVGQARDVAVLRAAIAADLTLDGGMIWALNDFTRGAAAAPGASAFRKGVERSFGMVDPVGEPKPVAAVLAGGDAPVASPLPAPWTLAVLLALLLGTLRGLLSLVRRRRARRSVILGLPLAAAFPIGYAGGYVVMGLVLTFIAELLTLPPAALLVLAGVAMVAAAVGTELVVRGIGGAWRRVWPRIAGRRRRRRTARRRMLHVSKLPPSG